MAEGPELADYAVDASALAKLFLDEAESASFREWYLTEVKRGATFCAPSLLGYQVAHLLARNLRPPTGAKGTEWFAARHDEVMEGIRLDEGAARRAFPWTDKLTGYDASYIAVAVTKRASLVSYDRVLIKEAERHGVPTCCPR